VYNGSCSKLIDNLFKEVKMSKVLTPTQTKLVAARAALVEMKAQVKYLAAQARAEKSMVKEVKADLRQVKRANAIAKAQARLDKLMSKPVGSVARKASKKPSPVIVTRMAA
jgi:predicted aminopeptidase